MKTSQYKKSEKGFSLVELLVVIAIIGVLAAAAIPLISGARDGAEYNAALRDVRLVNNLLMEAAAVSSSNMPATDADAATIVTAVTGGTIGADTDNNGTDDVFFKTSNDLAKITSPDTSIYTIGTTNGDATTPVQLTITRQ